MPDPIHCEDWTSQAPASLQNLFGQCWGPSAQKDYKELKKTLSVQKSGALVAEELWHLWGYLKSLGFLQGVVSRAGREFVFKTLLVGKCQLFRSEPFHRNASVPVTLSSGKVSRIQDGICGQNRGRPQKSCCSLLRARGPCTCHVSARATSLLN